MGGLYPGGVPAGGDHQGGKGAGKEREGQPVGKDLLAMLDSVAIENGRKPISDTVRKEALGGEPELVEEMASMRYVLR